LVAGTIIRPNDAPQPFEFHGDNPGIVFVEDITAAGGVGGSQSYQQTINSTAAAPDFYFYAGFGQFAVDFSNMPTGPDANNPAMYRFSADVKVTGNGGTAGSTPLSIRVAAIDPDYEEEHNIDVNGDGQFVGGSAVYVPVVSPVIAASNVYTNVSFTLNQGTQDVDADVRPQDRVFSNGLSLLWQINYHNGGFGFDAGNIVSIDNVKIEFLGAVSEGLLGDYNGNNVIDAADYTAWRNAFETGGTLMNQAETPEVVDQADYDYWKEHFGETPAGAGSASVVPEPAAACMAFAALVGWGAVVAGRMRLSAA
jgi:hypothetical protein